ncbi:hypothetical protein PAMP_017232 [Pampus punctatissimus]
MLRGKKHYEVQWTAVTGRLSREVSVTTAEHTGSSSYLQSLRDRQMGTGTSLSSQGTANHTMIDLDYDTGSTVPLTATTPVVRV